MYRCFSGIHLGFLFIHTACTEPTSVQNATYKIEEISNNFEVLYQCDTGLRLIGNKFTQCQVDATWTYPTFICTGKLM